MDSTLHFTATHTLLDLVRAFLADQTETLEAAILEQLNRELAAHAFEALPDGFVEWGCVGHGVVDVFAYEGQQIVRIDPLTMDVVAL